MALWHSVTRFNSFLPLACLATAVALDLPKLRDPDHLFGVAVEVPALVQIPPSAVEDDESIGYSMRPQQGWLATRGKAPLRPLRQPKSDYPLNPKSQAAPAQRETIKNLKLKLQDTENDLKDKEVKLQNTENDLKDKEEKATELTFYLHDMLGQMQHLQELADTKEASNGSDRMETHTLQINSEDAAFWQEKYSNLKNSVQANLTLAFEQLRLGEKKQKELEELAELNSKLKDSAQANMTWALEQLRLGEKKQKELEELAEINSKLKDSAQANMTWALEQLRLNEANLKETNRKLIAAQEKLEQVQSGNTTNKEDNHYWKKEHDTVVQENQKLTSYIHKLKNALLSVTEDNSRWKKQHDAVVQVSQIVKSNMDKLKEDVLAFTERQSQHVAEQSKDISKEPENMEVRAKGWTVYTGDALNELKKLSQKYK